MFCLFQKSLVVARRLFSGFSFPLIVFSLGPTLAAHNHTPYPEAHLPMFLRMRKPMRILVLAFALVLTYATIYYVSHPGLPRGDVLLNLRIWYDKISASRVPLDYDADFASELEKLTEDKFHHDNKHLLDFLWPAPAPPVEVQVPQYFADPTVPRPPVQPFDPRLTLWAYLNWARTRPTEAVPFHWSDWVDLSAVHKYVYVADKPSCDELFALSPEQVGSSEILPVAEYCHAAPELPAGLRVSQFPMLHVRAKARLLGRLFLFLGAPAPAKIVFLTNTHGAYHVDVASRANDINHALLSNGVVENALSSDNGATANVVEAYAALLKQPPSEPRAKLPLPAFVDLQPDWFTVDAAREAEKADSGNAMDKAYAASLRGSLLNKDPGKLFNEAKFLRSDKGRLLGDHHDWRFFDVITLHSDRQVVALHRLLKNYLHFCRAHGLVTWIAHGLLLLWYWNGMAFPWDADIDVQMPLRDLHRLGRRFNQTLVVESVAHDVEGDSAKMEFGGLGAFFVDVGSSITHRNRGNGKNNIDARFIDVHTGLYVDITGLAVSSQKAPDRYGLKGTYEADADGGDDAVFAHNQRARLYNCRNLHFVLLEEISPLVVAGVQNQVSYVPRQFSMALDHEYGVKSMMSRKFKGYYYLDRLRLWASQDTVTTMLKGTLPEGQEDPFSAPLMPEHHLTLLENDWVFREYMATRNFTFYHEQQVRRLLWSRDSDYAVHAQAFERLPSANAPMWGDLFTTKVTHGEWDYTKEVEKMLEMAAMYELGGATPDTA